MSLTSALSIGRSGLAANQAALEVAGNNLANAANPGYTRQSPVLKAATDVRVDAGIFIGTGVRLESVIRNVDAALQGRLRAAVSDQQASLARQDLLSQIESIQNDLSDTGLSSRLGEFFAAWSELANNPSESSLRTLVVQQGASLAGFVQQVHGDLVAARGQLDDQIKGLADQADGILDQIAVLNRRIATLEGGAGGANGLRDQRDQLIGQLAEFFDVSTVEQQSGATDVFLGGIPLVIGSVSRGVKVDFVSDDSGDGLDVQLRVKEDGTFLTANSGRVGALAQAREQDMVGAIDALNEFASTLILQLNRVHSQGQGRTGLNEVTGTYQTADPALSLTNADAKLDFVPGHGSFELHVTQESTGARSTSLINIDLDGIGGPDMSMDDLAAAIDAVANVSASVTPDGRLNISADSSDFTFSFADDTSGVLAALGINTYFTGKDASDIGVNQSLIDTPSKLAATQNHVAGDNANALEIAALQNKALDALDGRSISDVWSAHVEDFAVRAERAGQNVESADVIVESLNAQREAVSGVSIDEEAINLLAFQRAYQGSARFLSVVDELMQTLLGLV